MNEPVSTLRALFIHNDWARQRLMAAATPLADEALDRPFDMGLGSLRETIRHLWSAEQWWLDRWEGSRSNRPTGRLSMADLHDRFRATARLRDEFLDGLGEAGVSQRVSFTTDAGESQTYPLGDMMLHVCNHGVHHRAQAVNMVRHLGAGALDLDYIHMKMEPSSQLATNYDIDTIAEYFRYTDWARDRVLSIAETLDDDALDRPFEIGMGTLRTTLTHVCDAERWWLENWTGGLPESFESLPDTTTIAHLADLAREVADARMRHPPVLCCSEAVWRWPMTSRP